METPIEIRNGAHDVLTAWTKSAGFKTLRRAATDEEIIEDLLLYLDKRAFEVARRVIDRDTGHFSLASTHYFECHLPLGNDAAA